MFWYRISGLCVQSDIALPGVIDVPAGMGPPDVTLRTGDVPHRLEGAVERGPNWDMTENRFLLHIPHLGRFLMTGGREIRYQAEPTRQADLPIFLTGTVFGVLLHQRGNIVLHASAICVNGQAVMFCGASGAGKSTMAAALGQLGHALITDDIGVITLDANGIPVVSPDGRRLKLWNRSIERLGLAASRGQKIRDTIEKYYVAPTLTHARPMPLSAVYILREARPPYLAGIENPNLVDCAMLLQRNAYRPQLVRRMHQRAAYFKIAAAVVAKAPIFNLTRALDFAQLPALTATLTEHWRHIGIMEAA